MRNHEFHGERVQRVRLLQIVVRDNDSSSNKIHGCNPLVIHVCIPCVSIRYISVIGNLSLGVNKNMCMQRMKCRCVDYLRRPGWMTEKSVTKRGLCRVKRLCNRCKKEGE